MKIFCSLLFFAGISFVALATLVTSSLAQTKPTPRPRFSFVRAKGNTLTTTVSLSSLSKDKVTQKKQTLKVGDTLLLRMESQGGKEYSWAVARNNSIIILLQGEPRVEPSTKERGMKTQVFHFTAQNAGRVALTLHYRRPLEKEPEPDKIYRLLLTINK